MANQNIGMLIQEVWKIFKPVWRILLIILIFQFAGVFFSVFSNYFGYFFLNIWYGAAYASPIGFIFGLLWHTRAVPNGYSLNRLVIILIGTVALLLPIFGYFSYDSLQFFISHQMNF